MGDLSGYSSSSMVPMEVSITTAGPFPPLAAASPAPPPGALAAGGALAPASAPSVLPSGAFASGALTATSVAGETAGAFDASGPGPPHPAANTARANEKRIQGIP